ncbi:hypothetical protein ABU614_20180 [Lysobacter firmicutimachus]|uniref:Lipoprotein n=1 Tax=Lysobacter firmicutimachus TaxID=1792846 RepID=A0AAU8MQU0_9GAMM
MLSRLAFVLLVATALPACHGSATQTAAVPTAAGTTPIPPSGLRAIGNEPGWLVEVGAGDTPAMRLILDYGERRLDVAAAARLGDAGYRGTTADGVEVELRYRRETCSDGMSERDYPASVTLQVGAQTYRGCAEFRSP